MTILKRLLVAAFFTMTAQSGLNAEVFEIAEMYGNMAQFTQVLQRVNGVDESWQAVTSWLESVVKNDSCTRGELIFISVIIGSGSSLDDKVAQLQKMKEKQEQDREQKQDRERNRKKQSDEHDAEWMKKNEAIRLQNHRLDQINLMKMFAIFTVAMGPATFLAMTGRLLAERLVG